MSQLSDEFTIDMMVEHARKLFEANKKYLNEKYEEYIDRMISTINLEVTEYVRNSLPRSLTEQDKYVEINVDLTTFSIPALFYCDVFGIQDSNLEELPTDKWLVYLISEVNKIKGYHIDDDGKIITFTTEATENEFGLITWQNILEDSK
jgi:hypothetical protein